VALLTANESFTEIREFTFDEKYNQILHPGPVIVSEEGLYIYLNDEIENTWKWYLFKPWQ